MANLKTIWKRLRTAELSEIIFRTKTAINTCLINYQVCRKKKLPPIPSTDPDSIASLKLPPLIIHPSPSVVRKIKKGYRFTLNFPEDEIRKFEEQWAHKCWNSVPMGSETLDIRAVWEAGRLQHLTTICLSIGNNPNTTAKQQDILWIKREIFSWLNDNPFLHGPHYQSAMECGLRIISLVYILKTILPHIDRQEKNQISDAIYLHAWWISKRLSLFSSLGNHTVAECAGLTAAGLIFKQTDAGKAWLSTAQKLLVQETVHQIRADGGPAEQSLNYHRFVLDLLCWTAAIGRLNDHDWAETVRPHIEKAEIFYNTIEQNFREIPSIGDSDDGYAIAPHVHPVGITNKGKGLTEQEPVISFMDTGISLIRCAKDSVLGFDHGELGMAPLYNHGHADALSIFLNVKGMQIIADTGTYGYNNVPDWRHYFKGTAAHNTVEIDGLDQAVQETGFIWSHAFKTELLMCHTHKRLWIMKARHNGYKRLDSPVIHTRTISGDYSGNMVIKDTFSGRGVHTYKLHFHLHPQTTTSWENEWIKINRRDAMVWIRTDAGNRFKTAYGQESPAICGWFSGAYGIKQPATTLISKAEGSPSDTEFITLIGISENEPGPNTFADILAAISQ